jgi:hypothetical protein
MRAVVICHKFNFIREVIMTLVLQYIGDGKNTGRRVYHALGGMAEDGRKLMLVTVCGLKLPNRARKDLVLRTDDYERCPVCNRKRFGNYRRH